MELLFIILSVILAITTVILYKRNNEKAKTIVDCKFKTSTLKNTILDKDSSIRKLNIVIDKNKITINSLNSIISNQKKDLEEFTTAINTNILKRLRFITPEGQIAHNVKVKTIRKGEKILGIIPTIRRKVKGDWKEITLTTKIEL